MKLKNKTNKTTYRKQLAISGFMLGAFIISPLLQELATTQLGLSNYPLFAFTIGYVCFIMLPLLILSFSSIND